jgi:hypothetical protein
MPFLPKDSFVPRAAAGSQHSRARPRYDFPFSALRRARESWRCPERPSLDRISTEQILPLRGGAWFSNESDEDDWEDESDDWEEEEVLSSPLTLPNPLTPPLLSSTANALLRI